MVHPTHQQYADLAKDAYENRIPSDDKIPSAVTIIKSLPLPMTALQAIRVPFISTLKPMPLSSPTAVPKALKPTGGMP